MQRSSQDRLLVCGDLLVDSAKIIRDSCIEIEEGVIKGVRREERGDVDFRGRNSIILPGFVDIHVHLRGLEIAYKEDEYSGTLAALYGGLTAVVDMPNTRPPLTTPEALDLKLKLLAENSLVDYGVYAGVPARRDTVKLLSKKPILGFKIYPDDFSKEEDVICEILQEAETRDLLVIIHPEHPSLLSSPDYGYERRHIRSCESEKLAVLEVEGFREKCKAKPRIHITHVSCPETLDIAKRLGFTTDVTPHHLLFAEEEVPFYASKHCESKVNPPLRTTIEKTKLWIGLMSGLVDAIASDHAPHSAQEKTFMDPALCSPGFSSLEAWPGVMARIFYSIRLLQLLSLLVAENPIKILGVSECRRIERGCTGSLSIFSSNSIIREPMFYSKARISPYLSIEKLECLGVIVRGKVALLNGKVMVEKGSGSNLKLLKR